METLRFYAMQSSVDAGFWAELRSRKLNSLRLSEEGLALSGRLSASARAELPSCLQLDAASFEVDQVTHHPAGQYFLPGTLQAMNTLEGFKEFDRSAALQQRTSVT